MCIFLNNGPRTSSILINSHPVADQQIHAGGQTDDDAHQNAPGLPVKPIIEPSADDQAQDHAGTDLKSVPNKLTEVGVVLLSDRRLLSAVTS